MADQVHAEFLEVVDREALQHPLADLIFPERGGVLLKSQTAQPLCYVHAVVLPRRGGSLSRLTISLGLSANRPKRRDSSELRYR